MILADQASDDASIWQLVESCGYTADLEVWTGLAAGAGSVLDLGCGIGRVARHLADGNRDVVGVDHDPAMIADLNRLATEPRVTGVTADVTALSAAVPGRERFDLVVAPQQLLHIVGGPENRRRLLSGAAARLAPGGIAAFAIHEWTPGESQAVDVLPDVRELGEWVYASRPVRVEDDGDSLTVIRLRQVVAPDGTLDETHDAITLDRIGRETCVAELAAAGLTVERTIEIPQTDRHIGSIVLVARQMTADDPASLGSDG